MLPGITSGRGRQLLWFGVVLAAAVGVYLVTVGLVTQHSAPQAPAAQPDKTASRAKPSPSEASPTPSPTDTKSPTRQHTAKPTPQTTSHQNRHKAQQPLPASKPTRLKIPHINVDTAVGRVGRTSSDEIGAPKGKHLNDAAWFDESPTPGQYGPSVIDGHIDSPQGASVFYRLGALRHGNTIHITRKDGKTATFKVDKARRYPNRHNLPADQLLGGDVDQSGLRLLTCTDFDPKTGHYHGNTIIYAHLDHPTS